MTHPRNAPPVGASTAGADAETDAFLRDLRALRDQAGLGLRDLAARAHFPEDTLTMAEAGPELPSLPVLQAYIRGCGAGEAEWEDRWRRLNQAGSEGPALPTRAPSTSRPSARVTPFPEAGTGHRATEQEAVGFGLARVARGLAPFSSDPGPAQPGMSTRGPDHGGRPGSGADGRSAGYSDSGAPSAGAAGGTPGGWFDPAPKPASSESMFSPPAPPASAPPSPPPGVSPGAPAGQYPAAAGYPAPERSHPPSPPPPPPASYSASPYSASPYSAPSYRLPEEFRTPAPEPAGAPAPEAARGVAPEPPGPAGPPASPVAAAPKPHAAPPSPRRRTAAWTVTTVIAVLVLAAVLWLLLGH